MDGHDELEGVLDRDKEVLAVINIDVELTLNGIVDQHAGADVNLVVLTVPVGLVRDRDAIPTVMVDVAQPLANAPDDALGKDVWLLIQVVMVGVRIVEATHLNHGNILRRLHFGSRLQEPSQHIDNIS